MANKFKRVSESQATPDYIQKSFFPDDARYAEVDPYEDLMAGHGERRAAIAREQGRYQQESRVRNEPQYDFEEAAQRPAQRLSQRGMRPKDENMSNLRPEDVSSRGIRRIGYDAEAEYEGGGTRTLAGISNEWENFRWGSDAEYMNLLLRGASIWEPDYAEIKGYVAEAASTEGMFDRTSREDRARQQKAEWENSKLSELRRNEGPLRARKEVLSRANSIVRTANEQTAAGRTGMMDWDAIDSRERERAEMKARSRQARLAIKRNGRTPQQKHVEWEQDVQVRAHSLQERGYDWIDSHLDSMMGEGQDSGPRVRRR